MMQFKYVIVHELKLGFINERKLSETLHQIIFYSVFVLKYEIFHVSYTICDNLRDDFHDLNDPRYLVLIFHRDYALCKYFLDNLIEFQVKSCDL